MQARQNELGRMGDDETRLGHEIEALQNEKSIERVAERIEFLTQRIADKEEELRTVKIEKVHIQEAIEKSHYIHYVRKQLETIREKDSCAKLRKLLSLAHNWSCVTARLTESDMPEDFLEMLEIRVEDIKAFLKEYNFDDKSIDDFMSEKFDEYLKHTAQISIKRIQTLRLIFS